MPEVFSLDKLGPLPEPDFLNDRAYWSHVYSAANMRAYAATEVAKERERCAVIAERGDNGDWSASTGDYDARRGADIAKAIRSQDD